MHAGDFGDAALEPSRVSSERGLDRRTTCALESTLERLTRSGRGLINAGGLSAGAL
jgi:hypothetical protein